MFSDTGTQTSLVSNNCMRSNLQNAKTNKVEELLDTCNKLKVQWRNQAEKPSLEWADI